MDEVRVYRTALDGKRIAEEYKKQLLADLQAAQEHGTEMVLNPNDIEGSDNFELRLTEWRERMKKYNQDRLYPTVLMLVSPLARVIITEQWQRTRDMRACLLLDRWQIEDADTVCVPSAGVLGDYERLMGLDPG